MSQTEPLILDLVEWLAPRPRPYAEVIEAWRTSCPRLTVWEEATERGLVTLRTAPDRTLLVEATEPGLAALRRARPAGPLWVGSGELGAPFTELAFDRVPNLAKVGVEGSNPITRSSRCPP